MNERRLSGKLGGKIDNGSNGNTLSADEMTRYRRIAARVNFLAHDKMDVAFATKEATRRMTSPTKDDWNKLVRLGKYPNIQEKRTVTSTRMNLRKSQHAQIRIGLGVDEREDQHQANAFTEDSTCSSSGARHKPWWL